MIINKWLLMLANLVIIVIGYLGTVDWQTMAPSKAGTIIMILGLVKATVAALMPPVSQSTIVATGKPIVTHT